MMSIGSFSRLTGLSAKALRHYHDRGVLVPARVDPDSGYRTYDIGQVDDAVRIAVLRRADLPLDQVLRVVDEPDSADVVIRAHRDRLAADRQRVDRALDAAERALAGGGFVQRRDTPEQHFVAVAVPAPELETTAGADLDARVDSAAERVRRMLEQQGTTIPGPFWTALRVDRVPAEVDVHWPVEPGTRAPGDGVTTGVRPARAELVVRIPEPREPGDESVELALAALLSGPEGGRADLTTLRQTRDGDVLEFAVALVGEP